LILLPVGDMWHVQHLINGSKLKLKHVMLTQSNQCDYRWSDCIRWNIAVIICTNIGSKVKVTYAGVENFDRRTDYNK